MPRAVVESRGSDPLEPPLEHSPGALKVEGFFGRGLLQQLLHVVGGAQRDLAPVSAECRVEEGKEGS
eukprot:2565336-Lingulodinium_polyedra.AAC.1